MTPDPKKVEEVSDQAIGFLSGAGVSALVYLGDQLGLYRALSQAGPSTSAELAAKARLHERWVREWLHGQASAGLVHYAGDGRFELTGEQTAVLADEEHPAFVGGGFALVFLSFSAGRGSSSPSERAVAFPTTTSARTMPWERADSAARGCGRTSFPSSSLRWTAWRRSSPQAPGRRRRLRLGQGPLGDGEGVPGLGIHGYDSSELAIASPKRTLPNRASAMSPSIGRGQHAPARRIARLRLDVGLPARYDRPGGGDGLHPSRDQARRYLAHRRHQREANARGKLCAPA